MLNALRRAQENETKDEKIARLERRIVELETECRRLERLAVNA